MNEKIKERLSYFVLIISLVSYYCSSNSNQNSERNIYSLSKIGEIKDNFSNGDANYFWHIDEICSDNENNMYIADSGWNKIFRFSSEGKYLFSFGEEGQGPGEFLASPRRSPLKVHFGNNSYVYISDQANQKISVFSKEGGLESQLFISYPIYDNALVNSKGEIYLFSNNEEKAINYFGNDMKIKESFLDIQRLFKYPLYKPKKRWSASELIDDIKIKKLITKRNHLIVISNISLRVFHFDEKNKLLDDFMVNNITFLSDFKKRLKKAVARNSFIAPFNACLDWDDNICLCYYNSSIDKDEIYRYKINGDFLDILRFPEKTTRIFCINGSRNLYAAIDNTKIGIYKILKSSKGGEK